MSAADLEARFRKAAWLIAKGPKQEDVDSTQKLKFYSHYKQATEGDVTGTQPWMTNFQARAKWDAWYGGSDNINT
jgi:acyl-CoA-binding protein